MSREHTVYVRMNEKELTDLDLIAQSMGSNRSETLRFLVLQECLQQRIFKRQGVIADRE